MKVEKISLSSYNVKMAEGESYKLNAAVKNVKFKSSNRKIVTILSNGKIYAKKSGKALITVSRKDYKNAICKVAVGKAVKKISMRKRLKLKKGQSFTLKVKISPSNAIFKNHRIWRSSNKKVVTVSKNGKLKAKAKGKATISLRIRKKQAKCIVTVK